MSVSFGRISVFVVLFCTLGMGILLVGFWKVDDIFFNPYQLHIADAGSEIDPVSAAAFLVFDMETGQLLYARNESTPLPIASVTKLFTAATFRTYTDLAATTTIVYADTLAEGRAGKLETGQMYQNRDLLFPLLLESSNDAAVVLLRIFPELLSSMQKNVAAQGMRSTFFADTSGLSSENVSTALELSILVRDIFKKQPYIFDITRLAQYVGSYTGWVNNNPFADDEAYRGGKHGFTNEANRTGVFIFEETLFGESNRLIGYIVLGSADLHEDVTLLRTLVQSHVRFD